MIKSYFSLEQLHVPALKLQMMIQKIERSVEGELDIRLGEMALMVMILLVQVEVEEED